MKLNLSLFSSLKLPQKFLILGAVALLLTIVPFYQFFQSSQTSVKSAETELNGFEPAKVIIDLVTLTQQHRGMTAGALGGNQDLAAQLPAKKAEIDKVVATLNEKMKAIDDTKTQEQWAAATREWTKLLTGLVNRSVDAPASFATHTAIITSYLRLLDLTIDHFGLTLDSKAENHYLIRAAYVTIPEMNEAFGQLRALGTVNLAASARLRAAGKPYDESFGIAQRVQMASILAQARRAFELSASNLNKAVAAAPALQQSLQGPLAAAETSAKKMFEVARKEVIESQTLSMDSTEYFAAATQTIGEQLKLSDAAIAALGGELQETSSALRGKQITISVLITILILLGVLVSGFIMRTVTGPMAHLQGVMEKLRQGDSSARAKLETGDEIGTLARQFDEMVDQREAVSAQIQKENEQLNNSVLELLQGVAKLSQKDLTAKVLVAEDVTGAVADALNMFSTGTAKVLQEVTNISADVTGASLKVQAQSDSVRTTADQEREQVLKTVEELKFAAEGMNRIEQLAQAANAAADNALKTTQAALVTVSATVGGINNTRDTIRETEKRIKRLGERSQEISGVVGIINTIAERTHILALNASMHAASAGEAGRGFAVVAEEVQRLAESSRQATAQIATLVNNIQVETADTVTTMNAAISQVVDGSRLAEQAGEQMKLTQATTSELVDSVRQIASSSHEQVQISTGLLTRSGEIQKSTEETSLQLTEQATQTANLVEYARALLGSVRVFKLPA